MNILSPKKQRDRLKNRLDDLFARIVKARDGHTCQKCGSTDKQLNCAHFYSRGIKALRWEFLNAVSLCVGCHLVWAHREPDRFFIWFEEWLGKRSFEILQAKKRNRFKMSLANMKLMEILLKQEAAKYGLES